MAKGDLKGDRINGAYSQLRISGLTVQPTPEDLELALDRLESMMAEWKSRNICAGYAFEDEPDPNTPHNVERSAWQAIDTNLATFLSPDFNKQEHPRLASRASTSLSTLSGVSALNLLREVNYPARQPRGQGNTFRHNRWTRFYHPQAEAPASCETNVMNFSTTVGDIDDYVEHFDAYLKSGETLSSFTIEAMNGLDVLSSSSSDTDVTYRIEAVGADSSTSDRFQQVKIVATTSDGRIETRLINFRLEEVEDF